MKFDAYEIDGLNDVDEPVGVDHPEAIRWSLFGHIPGRGRDRIGDFSLRSHLEEILALLPDPKLIDPIAKILREKFPEELLNLADQNDQGSIVSLTVELLQRLWRFEN